MSVEFPDDNVVMLREMIKGVFNRRYSKLYTTLEGCLPSFARKMMEAELISRESMKTDNFDKIMDEFFAGMEWLGVSDLESNCRKFINILESIGPNQQRAGLEIEAALRELISNRGRTFLQIKDREVINAYVDKSGATPPAYSK